MLELILTILGALFLVEILHNLLMEYLDNDLNKQSKKVLEESREKFKREALLSNNTSGSKD